VDASEGVGGRLPPLTVVSDAAREASTAKAPVWATNPPGTTSAGILATTPAEAFGVGPAYSDAGAVGAVAPAAAGVGAVGAAQVPVAEIAVDPGGVLPAGVRGARPVRTFGQANGRASTDKAGVKAASVAAGATATVAADAAKPQSVAIDTVERLFARPERESTKGAAKTTTDAAEPASGAVPLRNVAAPALSPNWSSDASQRVKEAQRENGAMRVGVWNQMQRAVNETVSSGRNAVVIELKPPHLGDVRVTITASEQAVMAHFEAQSHTVRATLESNLNVLRDMLTNAGLSPDKLEVTVGFGGAGDQGAWRQQGQRDPGAFYRTFDPRHQPETESLSAANAAVAATRSPYRSAAVVDLLA
jgi:hypothetical protein